MAGHARSGMGENKVNEDLPDESKAAAESNFVHSLKMVVMLSLLAIGCAAGAYFLALNRQDDDDGDVQPDKAQDNTALSLTPHLICVSKRSPNYDKRGDVPYTSCDFVIYYPNIADFDPKVSFDVRGVKVIVGFNTKDPNKTHYEQLSSWVGIKYAILDLTIADDFSDISAKGKELQNAFSNIRKTYQKPVMAFLGIKVQPKDADATTENGQKLGSIANNAIIIFQTHKPPGDSCIIGINELMITKKNYEKLAEGINGSVAISTTIGVTQFEPKDAGKTSIGDPCKQSKVLRRSDQTCKGLSFNANTGHAIKDGHVFLCNTNATAQALFVKAGDGPPSTSWKFNIAFYDIEKYTPKNDTLCPSFDLKNFYRKGPRQLVERGRA
ncbi:uncharacterized protein LOC144118321 [Amblyomma americanum]